MLMSTKQFAAVIRHLRPVSSNSNVQSRISSIWMTRKTDSCHSQTVLSQSMVKQTSHHKWPAALGQYPCIYAFPTMTSPENSRGQYLTHSSYRTTTLLMRRSSTGQDGQMVHTTVPLKANYEEIRGHLKHLGPSNPASNPKSTKVAAVKIKPGTAPPPRSSSVATDIATDMPGAHDGIDERTSLLRPHMDGKDGIQALHQSYNTSPLSTNVLPESVQPKLALPTDGEERDTQTKSSVGPAESNVPIVGSTSSVGSLQSHPSNSALAAERRQTKRGYVRSGSITENVIEAGGVRKVVLEATSSGDEGEASGARAELVISAHVSEDEPADAGDSTQADGTSTASGQGPKKKNRRKKRKGSK